MGMTRKLARASKARAKAAVRLDTRETRRTKPERDAQARRDKAERYELHLQRLAAMSDDERAAYNRAEDARMERLINICGPIVLAAACGAER